MYILLTREFQITPAIKANTQYMKNLLECKKYEFKIINYTADLEFNLSVKVDKKNEIVYPQLLREITQDESKQKKIWVYFCDRETIDELNDKNELSDSAFKILLFGHGNNEAYYKDMSATYFKDVQRLNLTVGQKEQQNSKLLQEIQDLHAHIDEIENGETSENLKFFKMKNDMDELQSKLAHYETQTPKLLTKIEHMQLELEHNSHIKELKYENEMLKLRITQGENEKKECSLIEDEKIQELRSCIQNQELLIKELELDKEKHQKVQDENEAQLRSIKDRHAGVMLDIYLHANRKEKEFITTIQEITSGVYFLPNKGQLKE